jgi:hypothetical protein
MAIPLLPRAPQVGPWNHPPKLLIGVTRKQPTTRGDSRSGEEIICQARRLATPVASDRPLGNTYGIEDPRSDHPNSLEIAIVMEKTPVIRRRIQGLILPVISQSAERVYTALSPDPCNCPVGVYRIDVPPQGSPLSPVESPPRFSKVAVPRGSSKAHTRQDLIIRCPKSG